jgi:hypothetical protein
MKFYFHPDAEVEFDRAVEYYEQFQPGQGFEFAEEVYATITRIIQHPDARSAWPWFRPTCRTEEATECEARSPVFGPVYPVCIKRNAPRTQRPQLTETKAVMRKKGKTGQLAIQKEGACVAILCRRYNGCHALSAI